MTAETLAEAAARYAAAGVPVFPLREGHKNPKIGKAAGGSGVHDATTDAATVAEWWRRWPNANIGAACGVLFDVIDVDGDDAGARLDEIFPAGWPATVGEVRTPRPGGRHLYVPVLGAPAKAGHRLHLDTRGAGGYAVLPPSRLVDEFKPDGTREQYAGTYEWVTVPPFRPADLATVTACKPWARVWTTPERATTSTPAPARTPLALSGETTAYGRAVLEGEAARVAATPEGKRNDTLNGRSYRVGQLVPHHIAEADALEAMTAAGLACGLDSTEVDDIVERAIECGKADPWHPADLENLDWINPGREVKHDVSPEPAETIDPDTGEVLEDAPEVPPAAPDGPQTAASTWTRVDLTATLRGLQEGTLTRATPTVAPVRGGMPLFYRGKVNGLAGESGAGKTWTVLYAAAQALAEGEAVLYIDHEDDAAGIVGRMLDLDADPDAVRERFAYFNPSERPTAADLQALVALVADLRPALVVVDSTGEGLALDGANPNADEEVAAWFLRVPRRLALVPYDDQPGPAVVVLDHVTKADDAGLWPIGSQRKRAAISGAQYMQRLVRPFDQDTAGHALIVCAKDRAGAYAKGQRVAELHVHPGPVVSLDAVTALAGPFRPTGYMERVSIALEDAAEPLSLRGIQDAVRGKKDMTATATAELVREGYVTITPGPRNAKLHTSQRPFREVPETGGTVAALNAPQTTVDCPPSLEQGDGGTLVDRPPGDTGGTVGDGDISPGACPVCGGPNEADRHHYGIPCLACHRQGVAS